MAKVYCYRNLNWAGVVWSVKDMRSGLVIDRSEKIILKDVRLQVSKAGRARVLKNKRKNVHAGAIGTRIQNEPRKSCHEWVKARYNPYESDSFTIDHSGVPILEVKYAKLIKTGLWVIV